MPRTTSDTGLLSPRRTTKRSSLRPYPSVWQCGQAEGVDFTDAKQFDLAGKQVREHAFEGGRGGVYLELTAGQYLKLKG